MVSLRRAPSIAFALAVLGAVGAPAGKGIPPPPAAAALTVRAGRASLVQGEEVRVLTRASKPVEVRGEAYAEVAVLGEIELCWPGSASLRVRGPAALEWAPNGEVRVLRAERLELEVRRGVRRLALPGGWSLAVERGAIGAGETASGDWLVEHRGGLDVPLAKAGEPAGALQGGARVRLSAP
jgi:hypothetical protein